MFCGQNVAKKMKAEEVFPLDDGDRSVSERQCALELDFSRYLTENSGWLASPNALGKELELDEDEQPAEQKPAEQKPAEQKPVEQKEEEKETAKAWALLYGLRIEGLKETTVMDAVKKFGSDFLKGMSFSIRTWAGDGSSTNFSVGSIAKGLKDTFGAIEDPDDLA